MTEALRTWWRSIAVALVITIGALTAQTFVKGQTTCDNKPLYDYDRISNWCYYGGDNCIGCVVMR